MIGGQVVVAVRRRPAAGLGAGHAQRRHRGPGRHGLRGGRRGTRGRVGRGAHDRAGPSPTCPSRAEGRWVWDPARARRARAPTAPAGSGGSRSATVSRRSTPCWSTTAPGAVLLDIDGRQGVLDRVVCDRQNVRGAETPVHRPASRGPRASGPSGVADVEQRLRPRRRGGGLLPAGGRGGPDPAARRQRRGVKKLAATVRYCRLRPSDCPYANAFWNGTQMFYGAGYAGADDVVGHEMTHGVIDRSSDLFYWGQSGAINESLADIMGEIVDHRNTLVAGDAAWPLGEDIPGGADPQPEQPAGDERARPDDESPVGLRHVRVRRQRRRAHQQRRRQQDGVPDLPGRLVQRPDDHRHRRRRRRRWPRRPRSTTTSSSGSRPAATTRTSPTSSSRPARTSSTAASHGFTAGQLHERRQGGAPRPSCAPRPPTPRSRPTRRRPARPACCRAAVRQRERHPGDGVHAGSTWVRGCQPGVWGSNATSGHDSWYSADPVGHDHQPARRSRRRSALPAGQPSYLWFQQWRLLDYDGRDELRRRHRRGRQRGRRLPALDASGLSGSTGRRRTLPAPNSGRKGVRRRQPRLGRQPGRPVGVRRRARAPAVHHAHRRRRRLRRLVARRHRDLHLRRRDRRDAAAAPPPTRHARRRRRPDHRPTADRRAGLRPPPRVKVTGGLGKAVVTWQPPTTNAAAVTGYRSRPATRTIGAAPPAARPSSRASSTGKTYTFTVVADRRRRARDPRPP